MGFNRRPVVAIQFPVVDIETRRKDSMGKAVKRRVTLHDVAREAGVSIATVSRVINANYYVHPSICVKVKEAINKTGYYPDFIARSLKSSSGFVIGLLVSDISNAHFTAMGRAIEDILEDKNYNLIVCSTAGKQARELNYLKMLISKHVDGLIINTTGKNDKFISEQSMEIPTVLIHRRLHTVPFFGDFVDNDNSGGARLLARNLFDRGHRKIALISGSLDISTGEERHNAFIQEAALVGLTVDPEDIFFGDYSLEGGYSCAKQLFSKGTKSTGLVVMNNAMAIGVYAFLRDEGISVPKDISVISFGEIQNQSLLYINPTLIDQHPIELGKCAASLILSRISDRTIASREIVCETSLILGNSTDYYKS